MFFIHLNQSWGIQTNIFETNIINLAFIFFIFSNTWEQNFECRQLAWVRLADQRHHLRFLYKK